MNIQILPNYLIISSQFSDETRTQSGRKAAHPIVSCVLFVSADVGGPTLVTNQMISGGWFEFVG